MSNFDLLVSSAREIDPRLPPAPPVVAAAVASGGGGDTEVVGQDEEEVSLLEAARKRLQERDARKITKTKSASLQAHLDRWSSAAQVRRRFSFCAAYARLVCLSAAK